MKQQFYVLLSYILMIGLFSSCTKKGADSSVASINDITVLSRGVKPQIQINGTGFGNDVNAVQVRFNQKNVSIVSLQDNKMIVELPGEEEQGTLQMRVNDIELSEAPVVVSLLKVGDYAGKYKNAGYNDGPALDAELGAGGLGLAVDKQNAVYMADAGNNCIRKVAAGVVSTFAGNGQPGYIDGQGTQARFNGPSALAFDSKGNLFVADSKNHRIRKITPQGLVSTYAGSGGDGNSDGPSSVAELGFIKNLCVDAQDILYFTGRRCIKKITPLGLLRFVKTVTGVETEEGFINGTLAQARFRSPHGLVFDAQGNLFVSDFGNNAIRKITPAGTVSTFCGGGVEGFLDATGTNARFRLPAGMAIGPTGNIYVADLNNCRIRKISPAGQVVTYAGNGICLIKNGPALQAEFMWPEVLAINSQGFLFVSEANTQIRKIFW